MFFELLLYEFLYTGMAQFIAGGHVILRLSDRSMNALFCRTFAHLPDLSPDAAGSSGDLVGYRRRLGAVLCSAAVLEVLAILPERKLP